MEWCHVGQDVCMGSQDLASYQTCSDVHRRKLVELQAKDRDPTAHENQENGFADVGRTNCGLRSILGWRTPTWWRKGSAWSMMMDPTNVTQLKHKFGFHNRRVQRLCRGGRAKGTTRQLITQGPPSKEDVTISLLTPMRQAAKGEIQ